MGSTRIWFERGTQQTVLSRVSNLDVISRSGPNAPTSLPVGPNRKNKTSRFVIGESIIGGEDVVK